MVDKMVFMVCWSAGLPVDLLDNLFINLFVGLMISCLVRWFADQLVGSLVCSDGLLDGWYSRIFFFLNLS